MRLLAIISAAALLASCTTVPGESSPQVLRSFTAAPTSTAATGPVAGREPDLLLRDFFAASAVPTQRHQGARAFLTKQMADEWDDQSTTMILDRIDLNAKPGASQDAISYVVRGTVVGALGPGGVYRPDHGDYETVIELNREEGEWRISGLPAGVIMERAEMRKNYQPYHLFFFDPTEKFLVRDRRWVYNGQASLDTALISLLMEGPQGPLAQGVVTKAPKDAAFAGKHEGKYTFTGLSDLDEQDRHQFHAQLTWTLASAGVNAPYQVTIDGSNVPELNVDDVAEFNPNAAAGAVVPLYALSSGSLYTVDASRAVPVNGKFGSSGSIESADVSAAGGVTAAVIARGEGENRRSKLELSRQGGGSTEALEARSLTRPTFEHDGAALWTVSDGKQVIRVARSTTTGEVAKVEVDTSEFDQAEDPISVLRLSRSGVRVAAIMGGRVYVGTVVRPSAGERKIVDVIEVAPTLGDTALTLDWQQDDSLLVGTASSDAPVWRIEVDGSALSSLPAGNVTAPVVAIAASANTIYITDSRAVLRLPTSAEGSAFWREVPALQGTRAAPVVAN
ncbi:MtrAB system accessory lipoprotein LpqB [Corynebacterium freiburgense]|uniref:MtrAB system accessory lipoprotein LpqB n=1 Tax=Corynebacterium freiburgense TaxID=556548 RepID=UPI00041A199A|nr:MtrAB system accessory lipoprotein LpqB [Corynebacterium freiburgense]WJZ01916.1 Lipoprotein LpqB precursor [Corynebacterium freiburgense]